jgi:hypothetical protein
VALLSQRVAHDIDGLRALPWRSWPVAQQVDFRWVYANAEVALRELQTEKLYLHRPASWLEPLANNLIAITTYRPEDERLRGHVMAKVPAMVEEMRQVCRTPTQRDVTTAVGVIDGLLGMCQHPPPQAGMEVDVASRYSTSDEAAKALRSYRTELLALQGLPEFQVIGEDNYRWRYEHYELLPWTPDQLLAMAKVSKNQVDADMAAIHVPVVKPTAAEVALARGLTRDKLLALYDAIVLADRAFLLNSKIVTVSDKVGPIHARETPDAMVPLTGDGGSMDPPPPYGDSNVGWWNVEHFHADWSLARRLEAVRDAVEFRTNGMGPYAAHEGLPGHHLQLSVARLNPDPIRNLLPDAVENEGWALYAEDMFWQAGGLGPSPQAHYDTLDSFRFRILRVVYDVNIECGRWTLQQGADYKAGSQGQVGPDVQRAINWPAQLIAYYAGKMQILQLKADYRKKMGPAYSERAFHDALLRVGSIPYVFARAEMLGEPVPELPNR